MTKSLSCSMLVVLGAVLINVLASCTPTIPKEALQLGADSMALRQLQTKKFETGDEAALLTAGAAVLQDLGFNIDESEMGLGVVVGSKQRDARNTGQIVGAVLLGALTGAWVPTDKEQRVNASMISRKTGDKYTNVRITFQRIVWNSEGKISRVESLEMPELYQEFFDKLSKGVFLTAQDIG